MTTKEIQTSIQKQRKDEIIKTNITKERTDELHKERQRDKHKEITNETKSLKKELTK